MSNAYLLESIFVSHSFILFLLLFYWKWLTLRDLSEDQKMERWKLTRVLILLSVIADIYIALYWKTQIEQVFVFCCFPVIVNANLIGTTGACCAILNRRGTLWIQLRQIAFRQNDLVVSVTVSEPLKFNGVLCQHCVDDAVDIVLARWKC